VSNLGLSQREPQDWRFTVANLFLDDSPERKTPEGWDRVWNYTQFVDYIEKLGVPEVISFDHDLGTEHYPTTWQTGNEKIDYSKFKEKTGYDCAKYLVEKGIFPKLAIVHSYNIVGAKNIAHALEKDCIVHINPYKDYRGYNG
jgi:hypothetical protein